MNKICLCCGKPLLHTQLDWHPACIMKMFGGTKIPKINFKEEQIIDQNVAQGNTVTGVQKKFSFDYNVNVRRKTFSVLNNEYIVKTSQDGLDNIVLFEWIGMKLARICGIETVECGVINHNGNLLYITKRIDRINKKKIPMEDFCQLSNTQTEYKYHGSYERCYTNVIRKYSDNSFVDKLKFYKLLLFSYIIGNTDMHLKNFSLYEIDNKYQLTPAYDLVPVLMVFNQEDMALTLHGKTKRLTKNDFLAFGEYLKIEKRLITQINDEILNKKSQMMEFINSTILSDDDKKRFNAFITDRIKLFEK